jgi:dCTP deaminase
MPLSAHLLTERLWNGSSDIDSHNLCIVPLPDVSQIKEKNAAALDLRLGRWFRSMRQTKVTEINVGDTRNEEGISKEHYIRFNDYFALHPGEFVIGITLEWIKLPLDLSGYVTGKSSWGRRGLIIETAAGIHPGFTGCLTLELANVGAAPIKLNPGMQICQIFLHPVEKTERASSTQFVGYRKPGLGQVEKDKTLRALSQEFFDRK